MQPVKSSSPGGAREDRWDLLWKHLLSRENSLSLTSPNSRQVRMNTFLVKRWRKKTLEFRVRNNGNHYLEPNFTSKHSRWVAEPVEVFNRKLQDYCHRNVSMQSNQKIIVCSVINCSKKSIAVQCSTTVENDVKNHAELLKKRNNYCKKNCWCLCFYIIYGKSWKTKWKCLRWCD